MRPVAHGNDATRLPVLIYQVYLVLRFRLSALYRCILHELTMLSNLLLTGVFAFNAMSVSALPTNTVPKDPALRHSGVDYPVDPVKVDAPGVRDENATRDKVLSKRDE